jgi:adenylosuccinate lyase
MRDIWNEGGRLYRWLKVEGALAKSQAELGIIPQEAADEISEKADTTYVTPEDVWEREKVTKHDVMAMVEVLTGVCEGDAGKYVHLDATSYDIVDNALSMQIKEGSEIITKRTVDFGRALREGAEEYKNLPAVGRTHGQHAEPITFGFKFAKYLQDVASDYQMWNYFMNEILVGKPMTGAVGAYNSYVLSAGKKSARTTGELIMRYLELNPALITDQVVSRKMHLSTAEALAQSAATSERFAWEIWDLQRPEIGEVWEKKYTPEQVGSSTMPHKRNPINSENIISLSRVVRALSNAAKENVALHHERDLTNSAAERVIFPQSFLYLDEILKRSKRIASGMEVRRENVDRNLRMFSSFTATEPIMLTLVEKGVGRQDAHELMRNYSQRLYEDPTLEPTDVLKETIGDHLSEKEIRELLDPSKYTGLSSEVIEDVISRSREYF